MTALDVQESLQLSVNDRNANNSDESDMADTQCGIGPFRPSCLQRFSRIGFFTAAYCMSGTFTSLLSLYMASQISTIEKQFGFNSSQSGFLLSCNDIGFLSATMIASYAARRIHIPRGLWCSTLLYGVGGLICSVAFFISRDFFSRRIEVLEMGSDNSTQSVSVRSSGAPALCSPEPISTSDPSSCETDTESYAVGQPNQFTNIAIFPIAIGMIIQGITKSPRYPFLVTYVDDNGKKENTAMYMGIITATGCFGPVLAFVAGGVFSKTYVTLEDVSISPRHPAWIGAWWLGFVVFGIIAAIVAFPLACFPRRMKRSKVTEKSKSSKPCDEAKSWRAVWNLLIDFLRTIKGLLTNHVYALLIISQAVRMFVVAGIIGFGAKYMETQFFLPAWRANLIVGLIAIVPVCLGALVGGLLVTKRRLSPLQCIKLMLGVSVACIVFFSCGYAFGCRADIMGVPTDINRENSDTDPANRCMSSCHCDSNKYFPVCGSDGRNYFSPCSAGCSRDSQQGGGMSALQMFSDCGCIGHNAMAVPGLCDTECNMMVPYLLLFVVANFLLSMVSMPSVIVSIRSVSERDKSMAIGMSSLIDTSCGWLLGPVVLGRIIDTTCVMWAKSCDVTGACALYDNDRLRVAMASFATVPSVIVFIVTTLMFLVARKKTDWSVESSERESEIAIEVNADNSPEATTDLLKETNPDV